MEANRFAPPGAQVDDVLQDVDGYQPVRLWPPRGRIGRMRFLAYTVVLYFVFIAVSFVVGIVTGAVGGRAAMGGILGFAWVVIYVFGAATLLIQRSHDMDMSGWWSFAALIPLVGLVWIFKGGTPRANRWGSPPPPNGLGVIILGSIFPLIFVAGILAAVAIPAYHDYNVRAKAAAGR
jgi:uncharacterized membrane protein YhaH (DUF805 family)